MSSLGFGKRGMEQSGLGLGWLVEKGIRGQERQQPGLKPEVGGTDPSHLSARGQAGEEEAGERRPPGLRNVTAAMRGQRHLQPTPFPDSTAPTCSALCWLAASVS